MRERALPQASRKNVLRAMRDLLRPDARESFSTGALQRAGYGQARHVHALLTFLGFLDGDQPTHDVRQRRKNLQDFAPWLRRAVCEGYRPRLGDVEFLFDDPNQEAARSLAKKRVEAASQQSPRPLMKRNISQVVDCLLALRDVHRHLQSGSRDWLDPPPAAATSTATPDPAKEVPRERERPDRPRTGDSSQPAAAASSVRNGTAALPNHDGEVAGDGKAAHQVDASSSADDLVSRLAGSLSNSSRRLTFHARHVEINDAGRTSFQLADVAITIE